jgi:hypothetical protein
MSCVLSKLEISPALLKQCGPPTSAFVCGVGGGAGEWCFAMNNEQWWPKEAYDRFKIAGSPLTDETAQN